MFVKEVSLWFFFISVRAIIAFLTNYMYVTMVVDCLHTGLVKDWVTSPIIVWSVLMEADAASEL